MTLTSWTISVLCLPGPDLPCFCTSPYSNVQQYHRGFNILSKPMENNGEQDRDLLYQCGHLAAFMLSCTKILLFCGWILVSPDSHTTGHHMVAIIYYY